MISSSYIPDAVIKEQNTKTAKPKNRIIKTYHYHVCLTYDSQTSDTSTHLEDSDPEETQKIVDNLLSSMQSKSNGGSSEPKGSIGGMSQVDSGVVSNDSLLEHPKDEPSTDSPKTKNWTSNSSSIKSTSHTKSSCNASIGNTGKNHIENRQEEDSTSSQCRSHSVKQMISFFEGSPERRLADQKNKPNDMKTSPLLLPSRNVRPPKPENHSLANGTATGIDNQEGLSPPGKAKPDSSIHLTCVASGYNSKYTPFSEQKSQQTVNSMGSDSNRNKLTNGAPTSETPESRVNDTDVFEQSEHLNGHVNGLIHTSSQEIKLTVNGTTPLVAENDDTPLHIQEKAVILETHNGNLPKNPDKIDETSPKIEKNGNWFLKITNEAQERLVTLSKAAQNDLDSEALPDEVCGQIRAAIGKANLLVTKKFKQFKELCNKNLTQSPDEAFPTTSQDLAGFWDMVSIQVEDCEANFAAIENLRQNGWTKIMESPPSVKHEESSERTLDCPDTPSQPNIRNKLKNVPGKPVRDSKARDEARKRLMAAKQAMRERRNSESEDVMFVS